MTDVSDVLDVFPPIVVFQGCLNVIRDVVCNILFSRQVFSAMLRALHIEPDSNIKVFEHVIHDDEEPLILLLSRVFPDDLVKAKEARYQCFWVRFNMRKILLENASELEEFPLGDLLDEIVLVFRVVEKRATFA